MNPATKALVGMIALVLVVVLSFGWMTSRPEPAQAQGQGCIINISGTLGLVICGGQLVDRLQLPTVRVEGPTVTLPAIIRDGPTVRIPGPTQTVTQRLPRGTSTETVTLPGETITEIVTLEPSAVPTPPTQTETVTERTTATVSPVGQEPVVDDIIPPDEEEPRAIDLGDGEATVTEVGLGALGFAILVGLLLLCLYAGYILGYKDRENKETSFMRALLEKTSIRKSK